jgi:hypothetical protein
LVCRDGLKYYARIEPERVNAALDAIRQARAKLSLAKPSNLNAAVMIKELDMAAQMAEESCHLMLWQQALAERRRGEANRMAAAAVRRLARLDEEFTSRWALRNKGTPRKCSAFLRWRIGDYQRGKLHFGPEEAMEKK